MDEQERPIERETTVIQTGDRGGGSGVIVAIVLLFVVGAVAFFFFGGYFEKAADDVNVNVNVETPKVELPDVKIETPTAEPAPATNNAGN